MQAASRIRSIRTLDARLLLLLLLLQPHKLIQVQHHALTSRCHAAPATGLARDPLHLVIILLLLLPLSCLLLLLLPRITREGSAV